jgi:cobalt-precorrin 5A hydrolase/precorrin-3B C17-methyltransferase
VQKQVGDRCTCALALAPAVIDAATIGQARGRLAVVGLGPGEARWRTAEAQRLLDEADELVGYELYLELAGSLPGQVLHRSPIGAEQERCRLALERAAKGLSVALVCSGDPGIYALAGLVLELVEREGRPDWERVEIVVSPGVSAMQAAAARFGAPLGHDFCAISLSDLLTPRSAIERRLEAAAAGDFVVALYNPASQRRRELLPLAREILLRHRPAETPVLVARNLGREDETSRLTSLAELDPGEVDMLSLVLVGSSTTRRVKRLHGRDWVYTPRGYPVA